jgi:hypothetical protein
LAGGAPSPRPSPPKSGARGTLTVLNSPVLRGERDAQKKVLCSIRDMSEIAGNKSYDKIYLMI